MIAAKVGLRSTRSLHRRPSFQKMPCILLTWLELVTIPSSATCETLSIALCPLCRLPFFRGFACPLQRRSKDLFSFLWNVLRSELALSVGLLTSGMSGSGVSRG